MLSDINLGQIKNNQNYNLKTKFDEDNEVFAENMHSCSYFKMDGLKNKYSNTNEGFSTYSHKIRSINGH